MHGKNQQIHQRFMKTVFEIKQELKNALPLLSVKETFLSIKKYLPEHSTKFNSLLLLEGQYRDIEQRMLQGTLSLETIRVETNKIRVELLKIIDSLEEADFQQDAKTTAQPLKPKTGQILYRIPSTMQVKEESKCIIRVAFTEATLLENLEVTSLDQIKSIRISEVMAAQIIDPNENQPFKIRTFSEEIQFVEEEYFTEWLFFVMPLIEGTFNLMLKISVIELKMGQERKRDIVMEEKVVITTEAITEEPPFKSANYDFVSPYAPVSGRLVEPVPAPTIEPTPVPTARMNRKKMTSLASVLFIIGVSVAMLLVVNNALDWNGGDPVVSNDIPLRPKDISAPPESNAEATNVTAMNDVEIKTITAYKDELIAYVETAKTNPDYDAIKSSVEEVKREIQYLEYQEALLDSTAFEVFDYLEKYAGNPATCLYCSQAEQLKNYRLGKAQLPKIKLSAILFETGKSSLRNKAYDVLREIAENMKKYPIYHLSIQGHTDNVGYASKNLELSKNRAKSCFDYLAEQGIDLSRMTFDGFGASHPIETNDTKIGRSQNRRVEFTIQLVDPI